MTEEWTGTADEVQVHDRELTAEEIATLSAYGKRVLESEPILFIPVTLSWEAPDGSMEWWPDDLPLYRKLKPAEEE